METPITDEGKQTLDEKESSYRSEAPESEGKDDSETTYTVNRTNESSVEDFVSQWNENEVVSGTTQKTESCITGHTDRAACVTRVSSN